MTAILALDTARVTGWAVVRADGIISSGSKEMGPKDMKVGPLLANFSDWLSRRVTEYEPAYIFYEKPWVGPVTQQKTALNLMSFAGLTEMIGYRNRIIVRPETNPSVVKHFCGKSSRKRAERKAKVIAECRSRGFEPVDDNEADALAMLSFAAMSLRVEIDIPDGPLFAAGEAA